MATIVIPFAGIDGKTRLHASDEARRELSLAMLGDVLSAALAVGTPRVVTSDTAGGELAAELGADVVDDPGNGQGAAVEWALRDLEPGAILIVNADLPCATPSDLRGLLAATPAGGLALVEAADGTTNALSIPASHAFAALYGPGSAARFQTHARSLGIEFVSAAIPNLADDVDTIADLQRLQPRLGPRSQMALAAVPAAVAK
jgi:2-phospho-L-lactate guanylyltransferase